MLRIERQIRNSPLVVFAGLASVGGRFAVDRFEPFLDGVLVASAERGVHEIAHVGVTRMHGQAVAVLGGATKGVDVGDVEFGIDTVDEQVHGQIDDVDVAGAFAVAEQRAFHAVGSGHHAELGRSHGTSTVVVRVQADDDRIAILDGASEPLDHVAVHVGAVALDGGRQIEDEGTSWRGLDHVHHCFAHFDRVLGFGEREALG